MSNLKQLVNNPTIWKDFVKELEDQIAIEQKALEQASDLVTVHRSQGTIIAYRKLLKLREKVNGGKD